MSTYNGAYSKLPADAVISCTFGYPGKGGYAEYYRTPQQDVWIISNGNYDALEPFDWCIAQQNVVED